MANKFCIFPAGKGAQAAAYKSACNQHYAEHYEPGGTFSWLTTDANGDWVTQFYGEPFDPLGDGSFVEPEGFDLLRADAVIEDNWDQPADV